MNKAEGRCKYAGRLSPGLFLHDDRDELVEPGGGGSTLKTSGCNMEYGGDTNVVELIIKQ